MWKEPLTGYAHTMVIMPGVVARKMIDDETYEYKDSHSRTSKPKTTPLSFHKKTSNPKGLLFYF